MISEHDAGLVNHQGRRTLTYWKWRACEYFGLPWPKDADGSVARTYTHMRSKESGTQIRFQAVAGSMSPQLLVQITPLCWGIGVTVNGGSLAWRIGPIALKIHYGPMHWKIQKRN